MNRFADRLLAWFDRHGRHDLPWQHPRTPYRVWVSEIMLQQTRVKTVLRYFERFIARFPDLPTLAAASEDEVLAHWSGLGYYSRGRHLHRAAQRCMEQHGGELPASLEALVALPGIGRSSAAAILAQAHGQRHAILDGNVKRVLARQLGEPGWPGLPSVEARLWAEAEARLPEARLADYTQALMDLGALLCTRSRPRCPDCPVREGCVARAQGLADALPARRPPKVLPTRRATLLVLRDPEGRVLLERRQGKGVWQGLWSLPERPVAAQEPNDEPAPGQVAEPLPGFVHTFSHYRLEARPLLWHIREPKVGIEAVLGPSDDAGPPPPRRWVAPADWPAIGLPAPIRTLLESLP
jgi:A/G-specific adenine glycosylase